MLLVGELRSSINKLPHSVNLRSTCAWGLPGLQLPWIANGIHKLQDSVHNGVYLLDRKLVRMTFFKQLPRVTVVQL